MIIPKLLSITAIVVGIFAIALAPATFGQGNPNADRYIIQVQPGVDPAIVLAEHGLPAVHVYRHALTGFAGQVPPGRLQALANDPRVVNIAVDHQVFAFGKPTTGQTVPAGVTRVGAKLVPQTGAGIGVAVLDTGLDFNHRDLRISAESFFSPRFTYTTSAQDDHGHGTHVGGIVAALDNTVDVVGVAPEATLYAVKVLDRQGSGYDSDIAAGLDWVVAKNALVDPPIRVVNMSLGRLASPDDSVMQTAVQNVVAAGITVVVAAGNDPNYVVSQMVPAGFPEVITVASTTAKKGATNNRRGAVILADTASYFTTDGSGVAISAPGEDQENISLVYVTSVGILSTKLGGGTTRMSGTSMSAPHVAGVVALLLQKEPTLETAVVKLRIMNGDLVGAAPKDSPTTSYSFDGEKEGILYAPTVLGY